MTETPNTRATLYKKIAAVTAAVSRIPKNGFNGFHNYKYATESDITDGLRELLNTIGLAFLPPSVLDWERNDTIKKDGKPGDPLTRVKMRFEIACCDTGEVYTAQMWGEGQDSGDKGFYKAYTGAVKYFLMKTFLIATGDDPERDDQPPAQQRERTASHAPPATNGAPKDPAAAEQRFYARYDKVVGGQEWASVQRYLSSREPRPKTVDGWIAAAEAVRARANETAPIHENTTAGSGAG